MIKVVCIDNTIGNARHLELNKVYDASEISQTHRKYSGEYYYKYLSIWRSVSSHSSRGPSGVRYSTKYDIWIDKRAFISLEEFRQLKLDKILNNEI